VEHQISWPSYKGNTASIFLILFLFSVENIMMIICTVAMQNWFQGQHYMDTEVFRVICSCCYVVARVFWVIAWELLHGCLLVQSQVSILVSR